MGSSTRIGLVTLTPSVLNPSMILYAPITEILGLLPLLDGELMRHSKGVIWIKRENGNTMTMRLSLLLLCILQIWRGSIMLKETTVQELMLKKKS
ncbi:uncharacterized protein LOC110655929 isoform X2 [Hevea brasiliensis]|uniref:uncharacterized protein LOC110655929 isoform X2 n=1 Tax=Hevea brasiliensis TaxID=3981 RepID=UPI0025F7E630|nr:uncharacterized protein LOC110655929 isoform X2 [Hevea brasiliensis]XP_057986753.1 uncharacterized protein LOC110655929 isoform X2 [Hevea brasiliensis]